METSDGLVEFRQLRSYHATAETRRYRMRVRAFIDHSLHFGGRRGNGSHGTGRLRRQSHDYRHDRRWRPNFLEGLAPGVRSADRLSPRGIAWSEKPLHDTQEPHANAVHAELHLSPIEDPAPPD
jgi:hypothetical protein